MCPFKWQIPGLKQSCYIPGQGSPITHLRGNNSVTVFIHLKTAHWAAAVFQVRRSTAGMIHRVPSSCKMNTGLGRILKHRAKESVGAQSPIVPTFSSFVPLIFAHPSLTHPISQCLIIALLYPVLANDSKKKWLSSCSPHSQLFFYKGLKNTASNSSETLEILNTSTIFPAVP